MPGPSPTWDTKRVFITYRNVLSGLLEAGTWTAKIDLRVVNTLADGKRQVFRQGTLGSGPLNTNEANGPSVVCDLPIVDDPQNMPNGGVVTLIVSFASGGTETFKLSPLMSWPADGTDLALIVDSAVTGTTVPVNLKGIPGGLAALDAQGYVLDGAGVRVTGGSGSSATWDSLTGKPAIVAAGATAADARSVISVPSVADMNTSLNLKVNTSTYTSGLAAKADLSGGTVPVAQIPSLTSAKISDFTEAVQDVTGSLIKAGANVTVSYDDALGTFTINSSGGGAGSTDAEIVRDTIGGALVAGQGIQIVVNDAADTLTISVSGLTTAMITGLDAALSARVDLTSDQTIAGVKTFSTAPVVPDGSFALTAIIGLVAEFAKYAKFANSVKFVYKDTATGFWPASFDAVTGAPIYTGGSASVTARPTSSDSCMVIFKGALPAPNYVASGFGGAHSIDIYVRTP